MSGSRQVRRDAERPAFLISLGRALALA